MFSSQRAKKLIAVKYTFKFNELKRIFFSYLMSSYFSLCLSVFQDGKTAEDLAYAEQHEVIVSLLGKLKKVTKKSHTHTPVCKCDKWNRYIWFKCRGGEGKDLNSVWYKPRFHIPSRSQVYFGAEVWREMFLSEQCEISTSPHPCSILDCVEELHSTHTGVLDSASSSWAPARCSEVL